MAAERERVGQDLDEEALDAAETWKMDMKSWKRV
jgi:hypothetical protein